MEMTVSVRSSERKQHRATTAAAGVIYWTSEFDRVYVMRAVRIDPATPPARPDRAQREPSTFSPSEEPPMTVKDLVVRQLTTFEITADGTGIRMNFISGDGVQACLSLPTECLTELIMTLPRMTNQALRVRRRDESLRLVYPAGRVSIEQSSDPRTIIVTLATRDGFEVSFGLTRQQMAALDAAADVVEHGGADIEVANFN
jgi:hypothetical protein